MSIGIVAVLTVNQVVDKRHELQFLWSHDIVDDVAILIIIVVFHADEMLVCAFQGCLSNLSFKIHSQSFDSVTHGITRLYSR